MANLIMREIQAAAQRGLPFYVYVLRKPDGEAFYIGKGSKRRIFNHERDARRTKNHPILNTIRKVWREGEAIAREIDSWHADEASAYAREHELVAQIGCRHDGTGPLMNLRDGGSGGNAKSLIRWRAENPEAYAASLRKAAEAKQSAEYRKMNAERVRMEMTDNPKRLERLCVASQQPEARARQRETLLAFYRDNPEAAKEFQARSAEIHQSESFRQQQAEIVRRWRAENPELVQEYEAKAIQARQSPAYKARRAATIAERIRIKQRCLMFLFEHALTIAPPHGRAGIKEWQAFEAKLTGLLRKA